MYLGVEVSQMMTFADEMGRGYEKCCYSSLNLDTTNPQNTDKPTTKNLFKSFSLVRSPRLNMCRGFSMSKE